MSMQKRKPPKCCHPDCFNCPYVDCRWDGDAAQYNYIHSERGKESQKKYNSSEKGLANSKRKAKKRIDSGQNALSCRRYYQKNKEEILRKKKEKYYLPRKIAKEKRREYDRQRYLRRKEMKRTNDTD